MHDQEMGKVFSSREIFIDGGEMLIISPMVLPEQK
jgi:hypothetical protein